MCGRFLHFENGVKTTVLLEEMKDFLERLEAFFEGEMSFITDYLNALTLLVIISMRSWLLHLVHFPIIDEY